MTDTSSIVLSRTAFATRKINIGSIARNTMTTTRAMRILTTRGNNAYMPRMLVYFAYVYSCGESVSRFEFACKKERCSAVSAKNKDGSTWDHDIIRHVEIRLAACLRQVSPFVPS